MIPRSSDYFDDSPYATFSVYEKTDDSGLLTIGFTVSHSSVNVNKNNVYIHDKRFVSYIRKTIFWKKLIDLC